MLRFWYSTADPERRKRCSCFKCGSCQKTNINVLKICRDARYCFQFCGPLFRRPKSIKNDSPNSAHPYENLTDISNVFNTLTMMIFPFSLVLMSLPAVAGLPVDQHLGNLEGKDMRFGTSAGATFAAITVDVTCGAVNAEMDSLNPIAAISPMTGMWLNCIFGGKGVGMINMLMFVILGIFIAGMMVGRTPEYLGKKLGAREAKLAIIALLIRPLMILAPTGLYAATDWGTKAVSNPGPHGLSQVVYQFSSASANNGSAFDGLGVTYGFYNSTSPAPEAIAWDIGTAIVIVISRFLPIIAMVAMAAFLGMKKTSPAGVGTMRDDTMTFGFMLLGTILIVGALLFLPAAALSPLAEHLGPIPFGG
jgi:K+-transporting ATPase ATPase A chain